LRELWEYRRKLQYFLTWRDIKVRLQADRLGRGMGGDPNR
jgi:hypothetical protein